MTATIILCILSTLSFCTCLHVLVMLNVTGRTELSGMARVVQTGFSLKAWRFARVYLTIALSIVAVVSLVGVFKSYFELFSS